MKQLPKEVQLEETLTLAEIERRLTVLDEVLKTPERTVDDLIEHIQLLKMKKELSKI